MRRLFLAIFIPVLFILGTPALIATIMYDGSGDTEMPTYLYTEDADAQNLLFTELSASITDVEDDVTPDMVFNLHQDIINTAIFQAIRSEDINPNYMPTDDCTSDACNYIYADPIPVEGFDISLRIVGIWVDFADGQFITNVFFEVQLNDGFTYKTIFQTYFNFTDYPDKYVLEFDKIQLGNLPIPKSLISSILTTIDNQVDQIDLDEQASGIPLGSLDVANVTYTVMKDEILEQMNTPEGEEVDAGSQLAQEVLSIIFDEGLINFTFADNEFVLTAGVSRFRSEEVVDIPSYLYDMHFKENVDGEIVVGEFNPDSFNPETYLANKFSEYVFNNALVGGGFKISEKTFNKLIYFGAEGFESSRTSQELPNDLGENEIVELGLKAIWFELSPDEIYANALFRIAGIDSLLEIKAEEVSTNDLELVFEFTEITFGRDSDESDGDYLSIVDLDAFKAVFAELGDVEFGSFDENGTLTISAERLSAMMQSGSQDGAVTVTGISLVQDGIVLDVEPTDPALALALSNFSTALNGSFTDPLLLGSLGDVLDTTTPGPEQDTYNSVVSIQNLLNDGDTETNPSAEEVEAMFNNFESMDSAAQEAFLDTFEGLIDPAVFAAFDSSFGN